MNSNLRTMGSSDPAVTVAAAAPKPLVKHVALRWSGKGLCFEGGPEGVSPSVVDGGSKAGPSPMDHLLLAFAGCMGADVLDILNKSRVPIGQLEVDVVGTRAPTPPRRFVTINMVFRSMRSITTPARGLTTTIGKSFAIMAAAIAIPEPVS